MYVFVCVCVRMLVYAWRRATPELKSARARTRTLAMPADGNAPPAAWLQALEAAVVRAVSVWFPRWTVAGTVAEAVTIGWTGISSSSCMASQKTCCKAASVSVHHERGFPPPACPPGFAAVGVLLYGDLGRRRSSAESSQPPLGAGLHSNIVRFGSSAVDFTSGVRLGPRLGALVAALLHVSAWRLVGGLHLQALQSKAAQNGKSGPTERGQRGALVASSRPVVWGEGLSCKKKVYI